MFGKCNYNASLFFSLGIALQISRLALHVVLNNVQDICSKLRSIFNHTAEILTFIALHTRGRKPRQLRSSHSCPLFVLKSLSIRTTVSDFQKCVALNNLLILMTRTLFLKNNRHTETFFVTDLQKINLAMKSNKPGLQCI